MQRTIQVRDADGRPRAGKAYLQFETWDFGEGQDEVEIPATGELTFDDDDHQTALLALVIPNDAGVWNCGVQGYDAVDEIVCPLIHEGGLSWWHEGLGPAIEDDSRGAGVRIGVIDMAFEAQRGIEHVEVLTSHEIEDTTPPLRWSHGEAVCRILGDRSAPASCTPIAPGAELIFASASYTRTTQEEPDFTFPIADGRPADYLDPRLVANFIYELAFSAEVDLINLSLGSFDLEEGVGTGVAEAIAAAVSAGVTVVCAAGNRAVNRAAFPARLSACVAVGAFGAVDWGPNGSAVRLYSEACPNGGEGVLDGLPIFFWNESAYGEGVDVIGPGVGILIARDGEPSFDLSGTSFAAPIVAGLLAVELGRDEAYLAMRRDAQRHVYARRRLTSLARKTGMRREFERWGAVTLNGAEL